MPTTPLPLAPRDLLILAVLADRPNHGYGLIRAVEERSASGIALDPANLYRVLRRMRGAGWIEEREPPAEHAGRAGKPRRTYGITPTGRTILAAEVARLERLLRQTRPALAEAEER